MPSPLRHRSTTFEGHTAEVAVRRALRAADGWMRSNQGGSVKVLSLWQPWASLIFTNIDPATGHGAKWIETRSTGPRGPMLPPDRRPMPGQPIERGERIAIHASARKPERSAGDWHTWRPRHGGGEWQAQRSITKPGDLFAQHEIAWLPIGAILGTVQVAAALPMLDRDDELTEAWQPHIAPYSDGMAIWHGEDDRAPITSWWITRCDDQVPLGDFTPGRVGWVLANPERYPEPIPAKGRQGVWEWAP